MNRAFTSLRNLLCAAGAAVALGAGAPQAGATITDYSGYTYTWTDDQGVEHTSNLSEVATEVPQMKAMIFKVYSDPSIPGLKEVRYKRTTTSTGSYRYPTHTVDYTPGLGRNSLSTHYGVDYGRTGLGWEEYGFEYTTSNTPKTYTPTANGYTALLVQLKDDYDDVSEFVTRINDQGNPVAEGDQYHNVRSMDKTWAHIKSIEMIPVSKAIGSGTYVDGQKWGVAFNITKPLNKFFVMLKGCPGDRALYQHAPFYHMFEQLSPGHGEAFGEQNAYADMEAGKTYPVSHNCLGVTTWGHAFQMLGTTFDPRDPSRGGNVIVFVPYNRFFGEANQPNSSGNWSSSQFNYYDDYYKPYFMTYHINLQAPQADRQASQVNVALTWTSTLKDITHGVSPEEYLIMHRVNGSAWQPVAMNKVTTTQTGTTIDQQYVVRGADGTVTVTVAEPLQGDNQIIEYQIVGRIQNSDFAWIESNQQVVDLGGHAFSTDLSLNIEALPVSNYDLDGQTNQYAHQIEVYSAGHEAYPHPLTRAHIAATGTSLRLVRFTGDVDDYTVADGEGRTTVDTYTITPDAQADAQGNYTYTVTNSQGQTVASLYSEGGDDAASKPLLNARYHDFLFIFTDPFAASVAQAPDAAFHTYRVFATDVEGVASGSVYSNQVPVYVHGISGLGALSSYSALEVASDAAGQLPVSTPMLAVDLAYDPAIDYIVLLANDGEMVGRINRDRNSGSYSFYTAVDATGAMEEIRPSTESNFSGRVELPLNDYLLGKDLPLIAITYEGENTYGSPVIELPVNGSYGIALTDDVTGMSYDGAAGLLYMNTAWTWRPGQTLAEAPASRIRAWNDIDGATPFVDQAIAGAASGAPRRQAPVDQFAYDPQDGSVLSTHYIATSQAPTEDEPLKVAYKVRRYSVDPATTAGDRYVVTDGEGSWVLSHDGTASGLENVTSEQSIWPLVTDDAVYVSGQQGPVAVYSVAGSQVMAAQASAASVTTLSLGHLPSGVYIVTAGQAHAKVLKR